MPDGKYCSCEEASLSTHGPISDEEQLARVAVHPDHIKKSDGSLKPGVFPVSHFAAPKGLSVTRVDVIDLEELTKQSEKQVRKEGQSVEGVVLIHTGTLRAELDENGDRSLCVYDCPHEDNEAHAHIVHSFMANGSEVDGGEFDDTEIRRLRGLMIEWFSTVTPLNRVYDAA